MWRPLEFKRSHPLDVALAISGSIQHQLWQQHSESQNLKRLAYGMGMVWNGKNPDEVFDYILPQAATEKIEEIQGDIAAYFPANI